MKQIITLLLAITTLYGTAQISDTLNEPVNTAKLLDLKDVSSKTIVGAYAQIDYNFPVGDSVRHNGNLDVHRLIVFLGYNFNERVSFLTEIEIEHVKEVFIEQAFLKYKMHDLLSFTGGLILIPMGIINEYHEPPTFNGVERPNLDGKIVPTTWRELGLGFTGRSDHLSLKYQLYAVNGFNGYDGGGKFRGTDGLRKGRQKGAKSFMSSPNFCTKVDYYGINGLKLGLAGYFGKSQSDLYEGLNTSNAAAKARADSSVVGITMTGFDARYNNGGFEARGQVIYANLSNIGQYNLFTGKDLGSEMLGYYIEAGFDILSLVKKECNQKLIAFARYENYDTHFSKNDDGQINTDYFRTDITFGLNYKIDERAAFKADYQIFTNGDGDDLPGQLNFGIGIWFF